MFIVKHRSIFYTISAIIIALSVFAVAKWGLNLGIDFKGGSIVEVQYTESMVAGNATSTTATSTVASGIPTSEEIHSHIEALGIGEAVVRPTDNGSFIIRTKALSEEERVALTAALGGEVKRFDSVGPILGKELQGKAIWSITLVILAIVLFIAYAFRNVSRPISSWKYGVVAIVALLHDVIVPLGVFAFLGSMGGYEIDALFVTALLVILGFSIHDTIVVFDRTRENLRHDTSNGRKPFEDIVGESVSQTLSRSINTSFTTILALVALYAFGPETTKNFSLALIIGIAVGTYSSIFIGSPLLVTWEKWSNKKRK